MTRAISHYPTHLIDVILLAGRRVVLRPALAQDADLQRAFFAGLSEEARYFRFMTRLPELSAARAERFSDIDHERHVALLAGTCTQTEETMIGEARYVVEASDPEPARSPSLSPTLGAEPGWRILSSSGSLRMLPPQACGAWWPIPSRPTRR